ncbi:hypothetical protein Bbelb_318620 [Branchiostoma belcheri]|nr:hypothetical protein Bbelb_318620 [Branchiostoma belcheri]
MPVDKKAIKTGEVVTIRDSQGDHQGTVLFHTSSEDYSAVSKFASDYERSLKIKTKKNSRLLTYLRSTMHQNNLFCYGDIITSHYLLPNAQTPQTAGLRTPPTPRKPVQVGVTNNYNQDPSQGSGSAHGRGAARGKGGAVERTFDKRRQIKRRRHLNHLAPTPTGAAVQGQPIAECPRVLEARGVHLAPCGENPQHESDGPESSIIEHRAYLGASPDAKFSCKCHEIVVVELKCPWPQSEIEFLGRLLEYRRARFPRIDLMDVMKVFEPAAYPQPGDNQALAYWGRRELDATIATYLVMGNARPVKILATGENINLTRGAQNSQVSRRKRSFMVCRLGDPERLAGDESSDGERDSEEDDSSEDEQESVEEEDSSDEESVEEPPAKKSRNENKARLILDTLDDLHNLLLRTAIVVNDLYAAVDSFAGERQGNHNAADLGGGPHPHHNPGGVVWEHPHHNPAEPMGEYEQQAGPYHNLNAADPAGGPHPQYNPGGVVWEHPHHNAAEPMGEYEQQVGPYHNLNAADLAGGPHPHYNPAEPMEYEQVGYPQYEDDGRAVDDNQSEGSVILHLLETYGVFTDASPTPETVCLTDAVVITATRHLRVTYSIQHRYEGPPSEMLYMLELYRRAMLTRTTILKTHLELENVFIFFKGESSFGRATWKKDNKGKAKKRKDAREKEGSEKDSPV